MSEKISLKQIVINNKYFFVPYIAFLIAGLFAIIFLDKGEFFLFVNSNAGGFWDYFFFYSTYLGDGYTYLIVVIIALLIRVRYFAIGVLSYASSGIAAQILKRSFDVARPWKFFGKPDWLYLPLGIEPHSHHSFPSGHSASALSLFLFLSLFINNKTLKAIFFLCALITAISRIYIVQHFFIDVYIGSILGVVFTVLVYYTFINSENLKKSRFLNRSFLKKQSKET